MDIENQTNEPTSNDEVKIDAGQIRKATQKNLLNALGNVTGSSFNSVEEVLAWAATQTNKQTQTVQPTTIDAGQPKRSTVNDVQEQLQQMQQAMARKEQAIREKDLSLSITQVITDKFDPDFNDYTIQKIKQNIKWDEDNFYVADSSGRPRYNENTGQPMTLNDLVNEIAEKNPKILKQRQTNTGTGMRTHNSQNTNYTGDVPDYATDPAAFDLWAEKNGLGKRNGLKNMGVQLYSSNKR